MFSNKNTASTYLCLGGAEENIKICLKFSLIFVVAEGFMLNPPAQAAGQEVPHFLLNARNGKEKMGVQLLKRLGCPNFHFIDAEMCKPLDHLDFVFLF